MVAPSIVLNIHGGIVQDVFASNSAAEVTLVDWDVFGADVDHPDVVTITDNLGQARRAFVAQLTVHSIRQLAGTDAAAAIAAADRACSLKHAGNDTCENLETSVA